MSVVLGDQRTDEIAACAGSALVADGASQGNGKLEGKEKSTQQGGHYRRKYGHHDAEDAASHARRRHAYGASHNLPSLERPVKHASHEAAHDSRDALREALQHAEKRHPLHRPWSAHGHCSHSVLRHHGKARPPPAATTAQANTGASKAGAQTFSRTRSADPHAVKPHHDHTEHHPRSLHRDMAAVGNEEHPHHDAALERSVSRLLHRRLRHASVYAIALSFAQTLKALTHALPHARAHTTHTLKALSHALCQALTHALTHARAPTARCTTLCIMPSTDTRTDTCPRSLHYIYHTQRDVRLSVSWQSRLCGARGTRGAGAQAPSRRLV